MFEYEKPIVEIIDLMPKTEIMNESDFWLEDDDAEDW